MRCAVAGRAGEDRVLMSPSPQINSFFGQSNFQDRFGVSDGRGGKVIPTNWQAALNNAASIGQVSLAQQEIAPPLFGFPDFLCFAADRECSGYRTGCQWLLDDLVWCQANLHCLHGCHDCHDLHPRLCCVASHAFCRSDPLRYPLGRFS